MSQYTLGFNAATSTEPGGPDSVHRPIHYLGSKLRIASEITTVVEEVAPSGHTACDLFSGSAVVSSALASRWSVVAVDIQEYARVLASAMLNPSLDALRLVAKFDAPDSELYKTLVSAFQPLLQLENEALTATNEGDHHLLADLAEAGSVLSFQTSGPDQLPAKLKSAYDNSVDRLKTVGLANNRLSTISRHFGGLYFGFLQSIQIDVLREFVNDVGGAKRDTLMASLLATASVATASVGKQFAQPLRLRYGDGRIKASSCRKLASNRRIKILDEFANHLRLLAERPLPRRPSTAVRSDYADFLRGYDGSLDVVYADPPYTRDHYSRFYHVLETICLWDDPLVTNTNLHGGRQISRGVYRADRHQSPFSIRSQAPAAFQLLFEEVRRLGIPLVLSYSPQLGGGASRPRVVKIGDIRQMAKQHFGSVRDIGIHKDRISHSKLTQTRHHLKAPDYPEVLIVCEP